MMAKFRPLVFGAETTGLNKLEKRMIKLSRLDRDIDAALKTEPSMGAIPGENGDLETRTASDNAALWALHRANGRNPFILSERHGLEIFRAGANDVINQKRDTMRYALKQVANYMLNVVHRRIESNLQMKPLAERYRKWKERNASGSPILVLSGALLKSLRAVVVVMGREVEK